MAVHVLQREQLVPAPLPRVFVFFSDAANLARITPPWLSFRLVSDAPRQVRAGALLDYRIRWLGLPLRWRTRITAFEEGVGFTDEQLRGPYRHWLHEHAFEARGSDATFVCDRVTYELPLGVVGELAHALVVRRQLEGIFDYRRKRIEELFGPEP